MKLAIIDVGSNSVRLMLWVDGKTLYKKVITTRLGANLAQSGVLSEESIVRSLDAIKGFCLEARREGALVYAFATAAVRSAQNGGDFCKRVKECCGIPLEVISGKDEAQLGVLGALGNEDGGIIDIGGASTEVCLRSRGETAFSVSMNIGAVRLYDLGKDDMQKTAEVVCEAIQPLSGVIPTGKIFAIGGTASTLAAIKLGIKNYDPEALHHLPLSLEWVKSMSDKLFPMTLEERLKIAGMDVARVDVIAGATYLLYEIMKKLSCKEVYFSDSDNLEGYLSFRGLR
ncbi:MAG: hypothetical protein K2G44_04030 [Clostridia bacterium]|nr:hypothetical protein [Clostridia bacterium]